MTLRIGLAIASIAQGLRAVLGAPDYLRYVQHLRDNHPEAEVLTRKDFFRDRMENRYSKPGARCC